MKNEKIIYEPHPVTPERKEELRNKGYKIIDAAYAPEGYEYPESEKPAKAKEADLKDPKVVAKLTVVQLQEVLTARGVKFEADANKAALVALVLAE